MDLLWLVLLHLFLSLWLAGSLFVCCVCGLAAMEYPEFVDTEGIVFVLLFAALWPLIFLVAGVFWMMLILGREKKGRKDV